MFGVLAFGFGLDFLIGKSGYFSVLNFYTLDGLKRDVR